MAKTTTEQMLAAARAACVPATITQRPKGGGEIAPLPGIRRDGVLRVRARARRRAERVTPRVEILYIEGCPNHAATREAVERIANDLGIAIELRAVNVETPEDAARLRFLGSPTVRVNGHDIEPGSDERTDFARACRVYRTDEGLRGQPDEAWVREALAALMTEPQPLPGLGGDQ